MVSSHEMFRSLANCPERLANCTAISRALVLGQPIVVSSLANSAF
ncbi:uncharacterized protein METZ01_LOCUS473719 [marine metagenome]|uniref:Uncharacterized protein n=1 Tax=marine metagenome TaxID=408172 RepID=A0A383BNE0_9ZZZZ